MAAEALALNVRQALESASKHYMSLIEFGILKTFIDFKVFDNIPDNGSITIAELATLTGGEESLLQRFSDYLVASEILASSVQGCVAHTARSVSYRTPEIAAGFVSHVYNFFLRPMASWTAYFDQHGLVEPKDSRVIPLGLGTGHPDLDLYGILAAEPKLAQLFNKAQERSAGIYSLQEVYDFGWVRAHLSQDGSGRRPAIVDVGGGHGLALRDILAYNTFIPVSQCFVFDLPTTVEEAKEKKDTGLPPGQFLGGTMLERFPQAIRGAMIYQFRRVLSDFVDKDIVLALNCVREASAADTRVLLIEELVKPGRGKFAVAQDISVMNFGGKRRSEMVWRGLAEEAGFHVNAMYEDAKSEFAVIELTLA
ncbi:putative O-methyltransferase [Astrocystis sublimbata]|nr:putative O-methyltransferase [Astrocystis sublimbata]KAI0187279.1 putative O-methyltransferase [Astrocystis sublimbata]